MSIQAEAVLILPEVAPVIDDPRPQPSRSFQGLCVSCNDRCVCTFRKPEGGVWHCEEYQ